MVYSLHHRSKCVKINARTCRGTLTPAAFFRYNNIMYSGNQEALREEERRIRTFRFLTDLTYQRLCLEDLTYTQAREIVAEFKGLSGKFFPGKEYVFDLVISPRLERVILERFLPRN